MNEQRLGQSAHQMFGPSPDADEAKGQRVVPSDNETVGERPTGIGQLLGSLAITFISVGMLLGSFLLSQLDASGVRPPATSVAQLSPSPTFFLPSALPPSPFPSPTEPVSFPAPVTETATPPVLTPSPTLPSPLMPPSCSPPLDWISYTVQQGETLYSLAWRTGVTALGLMQANCLSAPTIYPDQQIYLPPTLYASPTPRSCGPPLGWTPWYTVQPGDTLFSLSQRFGVGIEAIRNATCLPGYTIYVGQLLYLPPPPPTPPHTPTLPPSPTYTPTGTSIPILTETLPPTEFPSMTPSPTPTTVFTPTSTVTRTLTPTPTPFESPTPTPTLAPTGSPVPTTTVTSTPAPIPTPTPTPMASSTSTVTPTSFPIPSPTPTETAAHTPTPTATPAPSGGQ